MSDLYDCEIILCCVSDLAIAQIFEELRDYMGLVAHTSGATPLLATRDRSGVFYPLHSFSKNHIRDFRRLPILVEARTTEDENQLLRLAQHLSEEVVITPSGDRAKFHLAAVISQNFTNHLIALSQEYLKNQNLNFHLLVPLLKESLNHSIEHEAKTLQSGPAKRNDENTINTHKQMLKFDSELLTLYEFFSLSIKTAYEKDI